jgi:hypothetical protein
VKTPTARTISPADLHLQDGVYYSDPANLPALDEIPAAWSFTDQTLVALSTVRTSDAITVSGLSDGVEVEFTATNGTIDKNGDDNFQASQTLGNGDTFRARHTASGSYETQVSTTVACGAVSDVFTSTTDVSPGEPESWQLEEGHFIPAKMAPNIIFPRPDTETAVWARNRRAPSSIEWLYRCCVQGGAFPGYWEIVDDGGATGLEFIRQTVPTNYHTAGLQGWGWLRWTTPVVGAYTIVIKHTDQDLTATERTFTLTIIDRENTTYFMFLDAVNGDDSDDGSYSSPRQTILGWYGANKAASTHATKQIFYRTGTYYSTDAPVFGGTGQQVDMTSGKPHVHVAYPGEVATQDLDNTAYYDYEDNTGDICYHGFRWVNHSVVENSTTRNQFVRQVSQFRSQYSSNTFIGNAGAAGTGSNSSCVMFTGGGATQPQYFAMVDNTFDSIENIDYALFYDTADVLCEGNSFTNGIAVVTEGAASFFFKALRIHRVTIRANVGLSDDIHHPLLYFSQFTAGATDVRNDIEFCWNNYRNESSRTVGEGAGAFCVGQGLGTTGNHYGNFWSYRNNSRNPHITFFGVGTTGYTGGVFTIENDVIHHSGTYTDGIYISSTATQINVPGTLVKTDLATGTNYLDATTNLLTGAARTTYLHTHGCEFG